MMTAVDDAPQLSEEEQAAEKTRLNELRGRYRTLPDMEARQRAIASEELPKLTSLSEPDEADLAWQETLIQEHYDLEKLAAPLKRRAEQMAAIARAHADPANREEPGPVRTPDLQTRNTAGQDPFRELDRVRHGLVEPREVRGRSLDAIEYYSTRGDLQSEFAENATRMAQDQYLGQSNVAELGPCLFDPHVSERRVSAAVRAGPDDHPDELGQREPVAPHFQREDDHVEHVERGQLGWCDRGVAR